MTRTPLSRSKGQKSTCRGRGVLWRPPAELVLCCNVCIVWRNLAVSQPFHWPTVSDWLTDLAWNIACSTAPRRSSPVVMLVRSELVRFHILQINLHCFQYLDTADWASGMAIPWWPVKKSCCDNAKCFSLAESMVKNVKFTMLHLDSVGGCSSPSPRPWALFYVGGEPLMSVTRGQCDARPTFAFAAAKHHRPLSGTKLYCLVTEARVLITCPGCTWQQGGQDSNPWFVDCKSSILTTRPLSHTVPQWPWKNRPVKHLPTKIYYTAR